MTPPGSGESRATGSANRARPGLAVRFLDALTGLLSAGILLVGVALIVAALLAPAAVAAAGLGVADGPGWGRMIAHLGVGAAGELVVLLRGNWPTAVRMSVDLAVVLAALLVIWWAWLP